MVEPRFRQERFLVVYRSSTSLYVTKFDSYDDALRFVGEDIDDEKAVIVRAGINCDAEALVLDVEDHT